MIGGVLGHCTDVEIDRQHTDTHGVSIVAFAFAVAMRHPLLSSAMCVALQRP
jgi:TnpA family transposase